MKVQWLVISLTGCSLYFDPPPTHGDKHIDVDAAAPGPDAKTCPATGTHAEITSPLDGAVGVTQPAQISMHVYIPNTLDGKAIWLTGPGGEQVDLSHSDADCSSGYPPIQTGPVQDVTWTECYNGLVPSTQYTWHIYVTCYDASGIHELAKSTFTTAAN